MNTGMVRRILVTLFALCGVCMTLSAQSDSVWIEVFKEDFGGNEVSDPVAATSASGLKGKVGSKVSYSKSTTRGGTYYLVKTSTDNGGWHTGSDHTYLGDKTRGYYMRVDPNESNTTDVMYVQELDGVCSGVLFDFSCWMTNLQLASEEGANPKLAISINSQEDGSGTEYQYAELELPKCSDGSSASLPWQELKIQFKISDKKIDKVYFIVSVVKPTGDGFDFAIDDISIKVQHPVVEIDKVQEDFIYGEPVDLYTTFNNSGYFSSTADLIGRWYYSADGTDYKQVSQIEYSRSTKFQTQITDAFDKDVNNGYYRLRIGNSGTFDSDVCSITGDYQIAETKHKERVHLCSTGSVVVEGYTVNAEDVTDGQIVEANSSLSIIVHKMEAKKVDKGSKYLCIGESYVYNGNTYSSSVAKELEVVDTVKYKGYDCDSIYNTYTIKWTNESEQPQKAQAICQGETFHDKIYKTAGEFKDTLKEGCALLLTPLTVNPTYNITKDFPICAGSEFNGEMFEAGGSYTRVLKLMTTAGCDSTVNATVIVTDKIYETLEDVTLCEGESFNFDGKTYTKPGTYNLEEVNVSKTTGCDSITYQKLTINSMWSNETNPIDTFICFGSSVFGVTYEEPIESLLIRDPNTYKSVSGCDSIVYYNLKVIEMELRLAITSERNTICKGEEVEIDVARLRPTDATLTWSHNFTGSKMKAVFQPVEDAVYVVLARNEQAGCETSDTMRVYVRDSPTLKIDTVDQKTNHVEYSVTGGVEPYTIYLDRTVRSFDVDPFGEVNNSFIGMHSLMVSDSNACTSSQIYTISPVPIVPSGAFTPNGDGVNDKWTIENIDVYGSARVRIYDRTGRLIKEFDGYDNEAGWDGTYNGHLMPPTDYWYEINLPEVDTQYVGHFTLFYNIR